MALPDDRYNFSRDRGEVAEGLGRRPPAFASRAIPKKPKYYVLEMFPYPSGRLHMGHVRNYTLGDVVARYKKAKGFKHSSSHGLGRLWLAGRGNAALERKAHPAEWTKKKHRADERTVPAARLLARLEPREITSCEPDYYYKHEQKMFLDFMRAGLAYRKESWVNWDPVENTVLANEQVIDGKGWRSGADVEQRKLNQWFLQDHPLRRGFAEGHRGFGTAGPTKCA